MFSLICAWINGWVNNCNAGDLRRHRVHYDVTVMCSSWKAEVQLPAQKHTCVLSLCWNLSILGKMYQYHGYWFPGSLWYWLCGGNMFLSSIRWRRVENNRKSQCVIYVPSHTFGATGADSLGYVMNTSFEPMHRRSWQPYNGYSDIPMWVSAMGWEYASSFEEKPMCNFQLISPSRISSLQGLHHLLSVWLLRHEATLMPLWDSCSPMSHTPRFLKNK